jgi:hypothetical protein
MRIFNFKSETNELYAFVGDVEGSKLPPQFEPWHPKGTIEDGDVPPHNFSRIRIEGAIRLHGFQLWRVKKPAGP